MAFGPVLIVLFRNKRNHILSLDPNVWSALIINWFSFVGPGCTYCSSPLGSLGSGINLLLYAVATGSSSLLGMMLPGYGKPVFGSVMTWEGSRAEKSPARSAAVGTNVVVKDS